MIYDRVVSQYLKHKSSREMPQSKNIKSLSTINMLNHSQTKKQIKIKNTFNNPYAAPFANTKTNNGRNGKKASINGNKIPGSGPRFLYFSRKSNMYSKNSFASCIFISINKITGVTPWKVLSMSI